ASGGPNENTCFCAQNPTYPTGLNTTTNQCDTGRVGVTYANAGSIFTDPNSGYMEICKSDGSVASYVGACFNRFCTGVGCYNLASACPSHYTAVKNQGSPFPSITGSPVFSYSCCFYNG